MKKHLLHVIGPGLGLMLAAGWLVFSSIAATTDSNATKAFVGARIIDGTGKAPIENGTLIVRNGRIEAVGKSVKVPEGAERIDASGKTIIPGLISGHSHVGEASQLGLYARFKSATRSAVSSRRRP
jgi:imidazolonepropionase-like amidohydrolase